MAKPGIWVTDPESYRKKMRDTLGGREPLEVMSQTAQALAEIIDSQTAESMRVRPYPNKWTPNEIVGHMLDAEWVFGYRLRLIYCQEQPTIVGMDQDLWVSGLRHNECEPMELVEMFRTMRSQNLRIWQRLTPADLQRTGQHNERGPESLGTIQYMCAGHDLTHLDQIKRYLEAETT